MIFLLENSLQTLKKYLLNKDEQKKTELINEFIKNEKITEQESKQLAKLQQDLSEYINLKYDQRYAGIVETDIEKLKSNETKMK